MSPVQPLDACPTCGLRFAGEPEDRPHVALVLDLHLRYCSGGDRSAEEWVPYRAVYESRRCHVVLVDSHRDAREAVRTLLEVAGHRIEEARDGPSGVEIALAVNPDVMLVDVNLPGFDGYEVARRVRGALRERPPFLVALTGYARPDDRRRAREAGFDEYLVKPADAEEIERVVAAGCFRELYERR